MTLRKDIMTNVTQIGMCDGTRQFFWKDNFWFNKKKGQRTNFDSVEKKGQFLIQLKRRDNFWLSWKERTIKEKDCFWLSWKERTIFDLIKRKDNFWFQSFVFLKRTILGDECINKTCLRSNCSLGPTPPSGEEKKEQYILWKALFDLNE